MSQNRKQPDDTTGEIGQKPIQAHLGEQLKRYFSSIVAEPVPDRFTNLLDELEKRERATSQERPEAGE